MFTIILDINSITINTISMKTNNISDFTKALVGGVLVLVIWVSMLLSFGITL